jgi:lipopolysaccharide export system permease protein
MTIFDLHIIRRTLVSFLLLVLTLIVFFVVLHYVEYVDDFMDRGATMHEVFFVYYPSMIPDIIRLTSPLAIFLACVYVMSRLAQQLQIMALETAGVSLYRLMRPYLLVALLVTGFMFWFNGWVVPGANATVVEFESKYLKDASNRVDVADIHRQNRPGSILSVQYFDRDEQMAHRVSLHDFADSERLTSRIDAQTMEWVDSLQIWRIQDAVQRTFSPDGQETRREIATADTVLNIHPRDLLRDERDVEKMTVTTASEYVATLKRSGVGNLGRIMVSYYSKFAYPFANLILVLLAVPLASVRRRGGQAIQIGLGLFVAFVYLAVMKLTEPFGYSGALPPLTAAILPHALFLIIALLTLLRAKK